MCSLFANVFQESPNIEVLNIPVFGVVCVSVEVVIYKSLLLQFGLNVLHLASMEGTVAQIDALYDIGADFNSTTKVRHRSSTQCSNAHTSCNYEYEDMSCRNKPHWSLSCGKLAILHLVLGFV